MRGNLLLYILRNALFPLTVLIFMIGFYFSSKDLEPIASNYPKGIMVFLLLLLLWTAWEEGKGWMRSRVDTKESSKQWFFRLMNEWKKPLGLLIVLLVYILLLDEIGFYTTTAVFLPVLFLFLGVRSPLVIILNSVFFLLISYLVFTMALRIPLPQGVFI